MEKNLTKKFPLFRRKLLISLMKLLTFFLCIASFAINPSEIISQNAKISIESSRSLTVYEVFNLIKTQTDYRFIFQEDLFNNAPKVYVQKGEIQVNELLGQFLNNNNYTFELTEHNTILIKEDNLSANTQFRLTGTVTDEQGLPLMGVNVIVKDKNKGVITDVDGKYSIAASAGDIIVFSYIGYATKEVTLTDQKILDVSLAVDVSELSEVVITGYYERKKENFSGAETTVKGEELTAISNQNLLTALSIAVPAFKLNENNNFGSDPNRLPDFQIRGSSSLNTSLDSEFQNNPNLPTFILDGFEVSAEIIFDLDPNRIASVTVLRDASATAIYGSRSANGVVVIETKRPKPGKMNIFYTANLNFAAADLTDYNLMNAEEKLEYERLAGLYSSNLVSANEGLQQDYNEKLALVAQGIDTDWIALPIRELGITSSHSLSLEGGNEDFVYALGLTRNSTIGAMKGSIRNRHGISVKLQHNREKTNFMNILSFNQVNAKNSKYGSFSEYTRLNPYYYPYDDNRNITPILYAFEDNRIVSNYLYNSTLNIKDESEYSNLINNFSFIWDINNEFRLTSRIGLNLKKGSADNFLPKEYRSFNGLPAGINGRYSKSAYDELSYDGNLVLNYNKTFKEKHNINAAAIYNIREDKIDSYSLIAENYPNSNLDHISMGGQYQNGSAPGGNYEIQRLMGFAGNINYSYNNLYGADFSLRSDASSLFGANDRWATFFSGGLFWNIHNYDQFSDLFQLFRLRASLGQTGGTRFNSFQAFSMYNYNRAILDGLIYNGNQGATLIAFGNPDLKWQVNNKFNFGLDFALLNNKLTGNLNFYREISENLLIDVTLAPSIGFPTYKENLGRVKNEGTEMSLKYTIINSNTSNLKWDLFVNTIYNKNSLLEINDALTAFNDRQNELGATNPVVKYEEGRSINTIWAVESLGIDPATGREIFVDRDGNITNEYNFADQKPIAVADPDVEGTFGTFLRYSNFELGAYFSYRLGGYTYNQTLVNKVENVDPTQNADRRVLYDRWQNPGDVTRFKAIDNRATTYPTSRFVEKDNELRFSSLNVSYNFGEKMLDRLGMQRLKMSVIANDVFRVNSSQIERGIDYPFARYYSFNLQLSL